MSSIILIVILIILLLIIYFMNDKNKTNKTENFTTGTPDLPVAYPNCLETVFGTQKCFPYIYKPYTVMEYEPIVGDFLQDY